MDFCLPADDGKEYCLKDFRGKYVVVYFYPKDNTPGCTTEAQEFTQLLPEFQKLNAIIIGISPDDCERHKSFKLKHGLQVLLLCDPEKKVIKKWGAWGKKKLYGKEIEGVIRSTFLISPDGKLIKEWKNVRAKGHAKQVLEFLKSYVL